MCEEFSPNFDDKTTGCYIITTHTYFDTTEVNKAELQAALNTLTEHDFQDAFKNGRSPGNSAHTRKGTNLKVMMASRLKVSF
jgi:hypothetical protein